MPALYFRTVDAGGLAGQNSGMMKLSEQITDLENIVDRILAGRGIATPTGLAETLAHYERQARTAHYVEQARLAEMETTDAPTPGTDRST